MASLHALPAILVIASLNSLQALPNRPEILENLQLHHVIEDDHLGWLLGMKGRHGKVPDYHVTTPWRTDSLGQTKSKDLFPDHLRKRRDSSSNDEGPDSHFHVTAFDKDYSLSVKTRNLHPPHAIMQIFRGESNVTSEPLESDDCYHIGHVTGHNGSMVAISTCQGMMGVISGDTESFFIHPLPDYLLKHRLNPKQHTHIVHRRSVEDDEKCTVGQSTTPTSYVSTKFNHLPYAASIEQLLMKINSNRKAVASQFGQFHVEIAIVVDPAAYKQFNQSPMATRNYVFTLLNMMQSTYLPLQVEFDIGLHLVRLIIIAQHQAGLPIVHDSIQLIHNFCKWQSTINPGDDSHPYHFDYAMLLTGLGLCPGKNYDCNELGRAHIRAMCRSTSSCAIVSNKGLHIGFVMAHELGHILGAFHDDSVCPISDGYEMVASLSKVRHHYNWSDCSKAYFRDVLRSDTSECLLDCPQTWHGLATNNPRSLPGDDYTSDQQCSWQFPGSRFCSRARYGPREICQTLYCDKGDLREGCWTTYTPAVDGTKCEHNKICYRMKCVLNSTVPRTRPAPLKPCQKRDETASRVDSSQGSTGVGRNPEFQFLAGYEKVNGGFGPWSKWGPCSRTCGLGYNSRYRPCNFPTPANGGDDCVGPSHEFRLCERQLRECSSSVRPHDQSHLQQMCSNFATSERLRPTKTQNTGSACKVSCYRERDRRAQPTVYNYTLVDGTLCLKPGESELGRCANGSCEAIGCDGLPFSTLKRDHCGVCGGYNQCCPNIRRLTTNPRRYSTPGVYKVAVLPREARNIIIREQMASDSISITLRSTNSRDRVLRYNVQEALPDSYAESIRTYGNLNIIFYRRTDAPEVMAIFGKLLRDMEVAVVFKPGLTDTPAPGLRITYTTGPDKNQQCDANYYWRRMSTPCSQTCGEGRTTHYHACARRSNAQTTESRYCSRLTRPPRNRTEVCRTGTPCSMPEWHRYRWGACSKRCGMGTQTREVFCYDRALKKRVDEEVCHNGLKYAKPAQSRTCNPLPCGTRPVRWITKRWSACTCGVQVRVVNCRRILPNLARLNVPAHLCKRQGLTEPEIARQCATGATCDRSSRKCVDQSDLCKVVKGAQKCNDSILRELCCASCKR